MDRRVARTRRALLDALIAMVIEQGWDTVEVRDLCERADVGRSTFYAHFGDKEALLVSGLDDLRAMLRSLHPPGAPPLGFVLTLASHAEEQRRLFRAIAGRRSGAVVQTRFRGMIGELVREDLPGDALTAEFVAGGVFSALSWWIDQRDRDPRTLADAIVRLAAVGRSAAPPTDR